MAFALEADLKVVRDPGLVRLAVPGIGSVVVETAGLSQRVHFTYILRGHSRCEPYRHGGRDVHEVSEGAGIIHLGPDRRGRFLQQGDYASVTIMIRTDLLTAMLDDDDALLQAIERGDCFLKGCRGAELHATAQSLNCSVHPPGIDASRASARHRLWLEGQGLSLPGLFMESRAHPGGDDALSRSDRVRLIDARDRLLSDLGKAPSLDNLAKSCGLGLPKLKRGSRLMLGNSVYGLFMQERMYEARRRLLREQASVT